MDTFCRLYMNPWALPNSLPKHSTTRVDNEIMFRYAGEAFLSGKDWAVSVCADSPGFLVPGAAGRLCPPPTTSICCTFPRAFASICGPQLPPHPCRNGRMQLFCLQFEASCLQWSFFYLQLTNFFLTVGAFWLDSFSFFTYSWSFFAYSGKVHLIRALRGCKQRSLSVSKKAPTVRTKAFPKRDARHKSLQHKGAHTELYHLQRIYYLHPLPNL